MSKILNHTDSLSAKQFSELVGVSPMTVTNWIRQGMPHQRLSRKIIRIDPKEATLWALKQGATFSTRG